ncbi:TPA: hypothetical protein DDW35_08350 [Candidatus Sumerlaeota bacterium]|jgi:type II secretory pathway component GspD/PulD (secretin)|nr:hypothetical protein [Candidatus Sumerlaeota bacterium]
MRGKAITLAIAFCVLAGLSFGQSSDPNSPNKLDQNVVKVLRTTNKSQINRYVPKVYEFKNVNPGEFAHRLLNDFVKAENGVIDTYVGPDGKSGLVLVVVPEYQIPMADELMKNMDRKGLDSRSGTKWVYAQAKNRNVQDPGFSGSLAAYGTNASDTSLTPDAKTNAVLVVGAPSSVDAVVAKIAEYDVPTAQVNVGVRMYEVNITNDGQLGLDYLAWKNGPGRSLFSAGGYSEHAHSTYTDSFRNSTATNAGSSTRNASGYNSSVYLEAGSEFFDFLAIKGKGNVLTEGNATVLNTRTASFNATQTVPYVYSVPQTSNQAGQPSPDQLQNSNSNDRYLATSYVQAGVDLTVTPTITSENILTAARSVIKDISSYDGNGKPVLGTRTVSTEVRGKSGEEIVLGGINRSMAYKSVRKMPVLGSIPVLGYLFGSESTSHKQTVVVQAITPTLVKGDGLNQEQKEIIQAGLELK